MKNFDVQSIELNVSRQKAFDFIADPVRLPNWTQAFASVEPGRAIMRTPEGEVEVGLDVVSSPDCGTVDWRMTFPNGDVATACSRLVENGKGRCIYSFILLPPPVPLEQLEGALDAQSKILAEELGKLKNVLEHHD